MPREVRPNAIAFAHSMRPGARVATLVLRQPYARGGELPPNYMWFVRLHETPDKGEQDPLDSLATRALTSPAADDFRAYMFTHDIRALCFVPGRGNHVLHRFVIAPQPLVDDAWNQVVFARKKDRKPIYVRMFRAFEGSGWPVFSIHASMADLMSGGIMDVPELAVPVYVRTNSGLVKHMVHFGVLTTVDAVRKERIRRFGARVLTCVAHQPGFIPEISTHSRREGESYVQFVANADRWSAALATISGNTIVVGPLSFLVIASRYLLSASKPDEAARMIDTRVRGVLAPVDAAFPPDAYLPPRTTALWTDIPE